MKRFLSERGLFLLTIAALILINHGQGQQRAPSADPKPASPPEACRNTYQKSRGIPHEGPRSLRYTPKPKPTRVLTTPTRDPDRMGVGQFTMVLEQQNSGSKAVEIGFYTQSKTRFDDSGSEITYDCEGNSVKVDYSSESAYHFHESQEIFYILDGTYRQEFYSPRQTYTYGPGDIAVIREGDLVRHIALTDVKAVAVWAPGGEVNRLQGFWEKASPCQPFNEAEYRKHFPLQSPGSQ